ncbi:histidine phosphatase family protein [Mycobacterium marseillense]|nr:histidine phosphatase family protein [Mycobacterium marseillense]ASW92958.1 phosphoglycerate mutase [Mycobacterium marseillense]MCA2262572.1 MSMEG_4193 family putative phosphomutase [Mycobacterium marseillense]MCV7403474.1 MSMEG_4193 family putative phosphomutase [Mycobacterium marseillense]MDM3973138.1 histidine phosphatase family protein [Mycobacterium marseillense]OBJ73172.1 phosphoglycerate mutase [Mycobacterium marseillense]
MTVILLRHGRSSSNTAGILAGRSEGVDLDDKGREQAAGLIDRIGDLPIRELITSPLLRCRRTLEPLADALCLTPLVEDRLAEVDYGDWTGRKIGELVSEPLWKVVQAHPSAAVFPGGEGLAQVQARAVAAVREHDRRLASEHGGDALWVACTHGDVIKAVIADAYGIHLDGFQRVTADPASVSVIRYTELRPFVLHVNHTGARLSAALRAGPTPKEEAKAETDGQSNGEPQAPPAAGVPSSDAVVGGSTD